MGNQNVMDEEMGYLNLGNVPYPIMTDVPTLEEFQNRPKTTNVFQRYVEVWIMNPDVFRTHAFQVAKQRIYEPGFTVDNYTYDFVVGFRTPTPGNKGFDIKLNITQQAWEAAEALIEIPNLSEDITYLLTQPVLWRTGPYIDKVWQQSDFSSIDPWRASDGEVLFQYLKLTERDLYDKIIAEFYGWPDKTKPILRDNTLEVVFTNSIEVSYNF